MAKSSYSFEKRQREIAKKKKKEKKRRRKLENDPAPSDETTTEYHGQTKPEYYHVTIYQCLPLADRVGSSAALEGPE